jgi:hypothetical protein
MNGGGEGSESSTLSNLINLLLLKESGVLPASVVQ